MKPERTIRTVTCGRSPPAGPLHQKPDISDTAIPSGDGHLSLSSTTSDNADAGGVTGFTIANASYGFLAISFEEAIQAVRDYMEGNLTPEEVLEVVRLYFDG